MASQTEETLVNDLNSLQRELERTGPAAGVPVDAAALCKQYNDLRPTIEEVLKIIEAIPIPIVRQIALVVRFLMQLADTVCQLVPSSQPAAR